MAVSQQRIDEMTSDETGATSYEHMHTTTRNVRAAQRPPTRDTRVFGRCTSPLTAHHWSSILTAVFVDVIGFSR
jgi:hypothetical protein